jgi:hypothetical protein
MPFKTQKSFLIYCFACSLKERAMADYEEIERVHGKHHTYSVRKKRGGAFSSEKYYVFDEDTDKVLTGSFDSRADAAEWAEKRAKQS